MCADQVSLHIPTPMKVKPNLGLLWTWMLDNSIKFSFFIIDRKILIKLKSCRHWPIYCWETSKVNCIIYGFKSWAQVAFQTLGPPGHFLPNTAALESGVGPLKWLLVHSVFMDLASLLISRCIYSLQLMRLVCFAFPPLWGVHSLSLSLLEMWWMQWRCKMAHL